MSNNSPRVARLLLTAACVCTALTYAPRSYSQASAPTAAKRGRYVDPGLLSLYFEGFIQYVGQEDDRIRTEGQAGKTEMAIRTDYASAIGIDPGEEQMMLPILLEAHHKVLEVAPLGNCQNVPIVRHLTEHEIWERNQACRKEQQAVVQEAWLKLKSVLGEESFTKFSSYLTQTPWMPKQHRDPNPCPPNYNPPPGETTHLGCSGSYYEFFTYMGRIDKWNRRMEAEGRNGDRQEINNPVPGFDLPEDKKQAVIALGLSASRAIDENDLRVREALEQYRKQHNTQFDPNPFPPDIDALNRMLGTIVEQYIFKFRQVVGEAIFKQFDKSLSAENRSIMKAPEAPSPATAPAGAQTPAVRP